MKKIWNKRSSSGTDIVVETEIASSAEHGVGFDIVGKHKSKGRKGVFINSIYPGSDAERNPDIIVGALLLKVNGVDVSGMTVEEVAKLLAKADLIVRLALGSDPQGFRHYCADKQFVGWSRGSSDSSTRSRPRASSDVAETPPRVPERTTSQRSTLSDTHDAFAQMRLGSGREQRSSQSVGSGSMNGSVHSRRRSVTSSVSDGSENAGDDDGAYVDLLNGGGVNAQALEAAQAMNEQMMRTSHEASRLDQSFSPTRQGSTFGSGGQSSFGSGGSMSFGGSGGHVRQPHFSGSGGRIDERPPSFSGSGGLVSARPMSSPSYDGSTEGDYVNPTPEGADDYVNPNSFEEEDRGINQGPHFFVGLLTKQQAEWMLQNCPDGAWLIRESDRDPGHLRMAVKYGHVDHIEVRRHPQEGYGISKLKHFPTILEMIEHYYHTPLSEHYSRLTTTLRYPSGNKPFPASRWPPIVVAQQQFHQFHHQPHHQYH